MSVARLLRAEEPDLSLRATELAALIATTKWEVAPLEDALHCRYNGLVLAWNLASGEIDVFHSGGGRIGTATGLPQLYAFLLAKFW